MRHVLVAFGLMSLLAAAMPASALAECTKRYAKENLIKDLVTLQASLRALDEEGFKTSATRLSDGMECLDAPVPAAVHARAYRYMGVLAFFEGRQDDAASWFRTSLEIDSGFQWDVQDFDTSHPVRVLFEAQRIPAAAKPVEMSGFEFTISVSERYLLDGRETRKASATPERFHIFEVVSNDGKVKKSWKIYGNQFPIDVMRQPEPPAPTEPVPVASTTTEPPKTLSTRVGDDGVVVYEHERSSWKTPLLIAGGTQLLLAGAAYGFSFVTHGNFDDATKTADVQSARQLTNTMVLTSGALTVTGLATGFVGMRLTGAGVGFNLQF